VIRALRTAYLCFADESLALSERLTATNRQALVVVKVTPINRGIPLPQSILCIPSPDDLASLQQDYEDVLGKGVTNCDGPAEPRHDDPYREERYSILVQ